MYVYIYIYIYYGEVYQDLNESFCIIRSSFSDVIFTHYWQKWLVNVILYRHELQIFLKLFHLDFNFMLHYGQRIKQVCFHSISMDSDYHNQCLCNFYVYGQRKCHKFCCAFLSIFVAYHVTFYSVVETPTLPQVVFNSLLLYNNLSILYVLYWEFQLKFQI